MRGVLTEESGVWFIATIARYPAYWEFRSRGAALAFALRKGIELEP